MLLASLLLAAQAGAMQPPAAQGPAADSTRRPGSHADRDAARHASRDSVREAVHDAIEEGESRRQSRAPRHVAVTPDLERTAFADAAARTLLARARVARLAQDSALRAYDAKTYQRLSVGMGFRRFGR